MLVTKLPNGQPEIFLSIQGEGKTVGMSCIFIRFSICNLHCKYCDSYFTWNFKENPGENHHYREKVFKNDYQLEMSYKEVVKKILALPSKRVVFTGGEPMIYQEDLINIMKCLRRKDKSYKFEIETNGTIECSKEFIKLIDQINCSPKLISSGNPAMIANRPKAINSIKKSPKTIFKFVLCGKSLLRDFNSVQDWQEQYDVDNEQIFLMPEGISKKVVITGSKNIFHNFCKFGYNLSTRLHVILFNNKRAV